MTTGEPSKRPDKKSLDIQIQELQNAIEALNKSIEKLSNPNGPCLMGPCLMGPCLMGPCLMGPCLMGPCLGPCLMGPCLGPCTHSRRQGRSGETERSMEDYLRESGG